MAYLDVISLATAKNYLKIDDTLSDDDALITSMINSVCSFIEKYTNVLFYARSKTYLFQNYCVEVYDYPINTLISPADATVTNLELYTIYETNSSTNKTLTLNVGYQNASDVPPELIDVALNIIDWLYYAKEQKTSLNMACLPLPIQLMLQQNKRYIL